MHSKLLHVQISVIYDNNNKLSKFVLKQQKTFCMLEYDRCPSVLAVQRDIRKCTGKKEGSRDFFFQQT